MVGLTKFDIHFYKSTNTSGGISNLGGARDPTNEVADNYLHSLFDKVTNAQAGTGITKFRCIYVRNNSTSEYLKNPIAVLISNTESPNDDAAIGWGTAAIGDGTTGATDGSIEQTVLDQSTAPTNVSFFSGNSRATGAALNADIPPGKSKALWIRIIVNHNAEPYPYDRFIIRILTDNIKDHTTVPTILPPPTPTPTPIAPNSTITVVGETDDNSSSFDKILDDFDTRKPDLMVFVGDVNDDDDAGCWLDMVEDYLPKSIMCFGPDDIASDSLANQFVDAFSQYVPQITQRYYSKEVNNIHFCMMDTSGHSPYTNPSAQYTWIDNDLRTAFLNPKIDWIVVCTSKTMYASQVSNATRYLYADLRDTYHQLFTKYGVCMVFQGALHNYQRSKVLQYNATTPTAPVTFDYDYTDANRQYTITSGKSFPDGQIYITCGTGGRSHDLLNTPVQTYTLIYDQINYGFCYLMVNNSATQKKLTLRFYSKKEALIDNVTLVKNL